ncbi:MAG: hypothetical protein DMG05_28665 [Acidobacteria bacterium]|nr:MAG: hypothetical protein DMG05_28665 [Acidobacteriota bacterium]
MIHAPTIATIARYGDRTENSVLLFGIVVVLVLVAMVGFWISRTSLRTTTKTMCWDIKGAARG